MDFSCSIAASSDSAGGGEGGGGVGGANNAWSSNYDTKVKRTINIWTGEPMQLPPTSRYLAQQGKQKFFVPAAIFLDVPFFLNVIPTNTLVSRSK